ncbi:hypothetical protein [Flavobacterium sp. HNIBRBA15423]|uniref:hypothetical protein n=1 Tax=Flavobacterium sp. HNIBRBA15423 TaxID=3458683 RepID=UPI004043BCD6
MKTKITLLFVFLSCYLGWSQETKLLLPNLENEFTVSLNKADDNSITATISDSKNSSIMHVVKTSENASVTQFTNTIFSIISDKTTDYYFKIPATSLKFNAKKENCTKDYFLNEFKKITKVDFITLVKQNTIFNNDTDTTTFKEYLKKINKKDSAAVFTTTSRYAFYKNEDDSVTLYFDNNSTTLTKIVDENTFYDALFEEYHDNDTFYNEVLLTETAFEKYKNTAFDTPANLIKIEEVYNTVATSASNYYYLGNYTIKNSTTTVEESVAVSVYNNFSENFFKLKVCNASYDCSTTTEMPNNIQKEVFYERIPFFLGNFNNEKYTIKESELALLYTSLKSKNEVKVLENKNQEYVNELSALADKIDNLQTQYSGVIQLNKKIRVYDENNIEKENRFFIIEDAYLRFFNNKVKDVKIKGYLNDKPAQKFRVLNIQYSIPMRSFSNSLQYVPISPNDDDADYLYINVNDIFDFDHDSSWNYSVKNKEYVLTPEKPVKIEERQLMDYFTAVVFSDFLGLNNNNSNALIQAEGRIKIPLWISNYRKTAVFNAISTDVNATIYNGSDETNRLITPIETTTVDGKTSFTIHNFDYIKFNNINAGIHLGLINVELKGLSTEVNLGYGLRYYRAGLKYIEDTAGIDVIKTYQLNALSHELLVNFEIRPQMNFGADLNLCLNWLNSRGASDDILIHLKDAESANDKKVFRLQLNLYSKLNPDKTNDGIYARIGGFYHLAAKEYYPQILVGYATNLSTFVNKFKKGN